MYNVLEFSKPDIRLLSRGGVEYPFSIRPNEFAETRRVAIELTIQITLCVLAFEMENINREADIVKIMVLAVFQMLEKLTVVVVKDVGREGTGKIWRESRLQKRLGELGVRSEIRIMKAYIHGRDTLRTEKCCP